MLKEERATISSISGCLGVVAVLPMDHEIGKGIN